MNADAAPAAAVVAAKMHGAGNTFVVLDERPARFARYETVARTACARDGAFGGADGLLVVRETPGEAAEMQIYNADGSRAEMCGNGIRCVARYLHDRGEGDAFTIATLAGPIAATVVSHAPFAARVDMGLVTFSGGGDGERLELEDAAWTFVAVSVGNPHAVIFVDEPDAVDLERLGAAFNRHARFEHGTNVHLVAVDGPASLRVRHYERGVGLTQACGTGAVACAAAAVAVRDVRSPLDVRVPGGVLRVAWRAGAHAELTGPAEPLFEHAFVP